MAAKIQKWTADKIRALKGHGRFACLTAADCGTARMLDEAGIPLILVGDSLAMTVLGYRNTLPVTVDQMLHHTAAVARGTRRALVVADMPFMSYQVSAAQAVKNAGRFIKEAGADAVKIEGGAIRVETIKALVANGIPVLGHIGLTPQSVKAGGYRVKGRTLPEARTLIGDARSIARAGAFAIVIECVPAVLGRRLTAAAPVPTIGIGAGPGCDGQILVTHDLLGMFQDFTPKFARRYADLGAAMRRAFAAFRDDVARGRFPSNAESY